MMDPAYCDDMPTIATLTDFERGLVFSLHAVVATGSNADNAATLERMRWQALSLWHENNRQIPAVFHLGRFVKIDRIDNEQSANITQHQP